MMDHDVTLIDLTYMLIAAESAMIWRAGRANLSGELNSDQWTLKMVTLEIQKRKTLRYFLVPFQKSPFAFIAKRRGIRDEAAQTT